MWLTYKGGVYESGCKDPWDKPLPNGMRRTRKGIAENQRFVIRHKPTGMWLAAYNSHGSSTNHGGRYTYNGNWDTPGSVGLTEDIGLAMWWRSSNSLRNCISQHASRLNQDRNAMLYANTRAKRDGRPPAYAPAQIPPEVMTYIREHGDEFEIVEVYIGMSVVAEGIITKGKLGSKP